MRAKPPRRPSPYGGQDPFSPATSNGSSMGLNGASSTREAPKDEATVVLVAAAVDVAGAVAVAAATAATSKVRRSSTVGSNTTNIEVVVEPHLNKFFLL